VLGSNVVRSGRVFQVRSDLEVAFSGVCREIDRPHRLVKTEVFELVPDAEAVSTTTFDESDGVTTVKILARDPSKEHRDAAIESGMEGGVQTSLNELEELVRQG
jgi:uncharacterized protein YndB with AHSA1/START domain